MDWSLRGGLAPLDGPMDGKGRHPTDLVMPKAPTALAGPAPPRFLVAPFQALLQPVPTPELLARSSRTIKVGDTVAVEELTGWLVDRSMTRAEVVEVPGEFSLRGGILDVFPPDA